MILRSDNHQEDMDLVKPYYPIFDWLVQNGYNMYGTKDYFVYEYSNWAEYFFLNCHTIALWKNTPLNNPNDPVAMPLSYSQWGLIPRRKRSLRLCGGEVHLKKWRMAIICGILYIRKRWKY
jgi:hypothetical protein